jgi:hypothetical protein
LAFRVGVTGKRPRSSEDQARIEALRPCINQVLAFVQHEVEGLAQPLRDTKHARRDEVPVYAVDGAGSQAGLRLMSPLAEGADRVVAEEAGALGYKLDVVLPFLADEYSRDFPDSEAAFQTLFGKAETRLVLDGDPGTLNGGRGETGGQADQVKRSRAYQAAGRMVVRNSDLIIAIWDGEPGRGDGGTADIVLFSVRFGVPVCWIDTDPDKPVRMLLNLPQYWQRDCNDPQLESAACVPNGELAFKALRECLVAAIVPPTHPKPRRSGVVGGMVQGIADWTGKNPSPLQVFLQEKELPRQTFWRAYDWFLTLAATRAAGERREMGPAASGLESYWEQKYRAANTLSQQYGARYRSSYVLVFLASMFGFAASVASLAFTQLGKVWTFIELAAIAGIVMLVLLNHLYLWHERWITYRLLAELCRKQRVLATLGRGLPGRAISAMANDAVANEGEVPREAWVAWMFGAALRAAPRPQGELNLQVLEHAKACCQDMLAEQIAYHEDRRERCRAANESLAKIGGWGFVAAAALVGLGLAHSFPPEPSAALNYLGCFLAILSAAFTGIRAYAEFDLLAEESDRMLRVMKAGQSMVKLLPLQHQQASQDLGAELAEIAGAMLQDVAGWAQLFRLKALETN